MLTLGDIGNATDMVRPTLSPPCVRVTPWLRYAFSRTQCISKQNRKLLYVRKRPEEMSGGKHGDARCLGVSMHVGHLYHVVRIRLSVIVSDAGTQLTEVEHFVDVVNQSRQHVEMDWV